MQRGPLSVGLGCPGPFCRLSNGGILPCSLAPLLPAVHTFILCVGSQKAPAILCDPEARPIIGSFFFLFFPFFFPFSFSLFLSFLSYYAFFRLSFSLISFFLFPLFFFILLGKSPKRSVARKVGVGCTALLLSGPCGGCPGLCSA